MCPSSHPFFFSACHLVGRSLCASAACYACFACALTARDLAQAPQGAEDDGSGDGYDAGAKVSVAELLAIGMGTIEDARALLLWAHEGQKRSPERSIIGEGSAQSPQFSRRGNPGHFG